jgi:hypothetical protein
MSDNGWFVNHDKLQHYTSGALMSWFIRKSPFARSEDVVRHMLELLAHEADKAGSPLTHLERETLAKEYSRFEPLPEDLRHRAKELITRIFEAESWDEFENDPKCFSNSVEWASDLGCPNVVALAEEVRCEIARLTPPLRGWKRVRDAVQLVGCGLLIVLLMFAVVIAAGFLFHWK